MNRTPSALACVSSSGREVTFCFAITCFIIAVPSPPMFILERVRCPAPFGSIHPKSLPIRLFRTAGAGSRRRTLSPQNVKKITTFLPAAAMPQAIISAAIALSRSLLKSTIAAESPSAEHDELPVEAAFSPEPLRRTAFRKSPPLSFESA